MLPEHTNSSDSLFDGNFDMEVKILSSKGCSQNGNNTVDSCQNTSDLNISNPPAADVSAALDQLRAYGPEVPRCVACLVAKLITITPVV